MKRPKKKPARPSKRTRKTRSSAKPAPVRRAPVDGSGLAPGMQAISAYLAVANVLASMQFLERTFGFSRGVTLASTDGQLRYAEMRHGDSAVVLVRKGETTAATNGAAALYAYVPDVDRAVADARHAGVAVEDPEDKPWGDRAATVTDPDGYRWVLATFKKLAPFA